MQTVFPRAIGHRASGGLINNVYLAVNDDVLAVRKVQVQRRQRLLNHLFACTAKAPHATELLRQANDRLAAGWRESHRTFRCVQDPQLPHESTRDVEGDR